MQNFCISGAIFPKSRRETARFQHTGIENALLLFMTDDPGGKNGLPTPRPAEQVTSKWTQVGGMVAEWWRDGGKSRSKSAKVGKSRSIQAKTALFTPLFALFAHYSLFIHFISLCPSTVIHIIHSN